MRVASQKRYQDVQLMQVLDVHPVRERLFQRSRCQWISQKGYTGTGLEVPDYMRSATNLILSVVKQYTVLLTGSTSQLDNPAKNAHFKKSYPMKYSSSFIIHELIVLLYTPLKKVIPKHVGCKEGSSCIYLYGDNHWNCIF